MEFIKESIEKIDKFHKSDTGRKLAITLKITGKIVTTVTNIVGAPPLVGILGSALGIGADMLNPPLNLAMLTKQKEELQLSIAESSDFAKELLEKNLEDIQDSISESLANHTKNLQEEVQKSFKDISERLHSIEKELSNVSEITNQIHEVVLELRHMEGLETLEGAYKTFLDGSHNLNETFNLFSNFIIELQTKAFQSLRPEKIQKYLSRLSRSKSKEFVLETLEYILMVRGKYLLLVAGFYLFKNDLERVGKEYDSFNDDCEEFMKLRESIVSEEFADSIAPLEIPIEEAIQDRKNSAIFRQQSYKPDDKLKELLNDLELGYLVEVFIAEGINSDLLMMCNDEELEKMGLNLGERKIILKYITREDKELGGVIEKEKKHSLGTPYRKSSNVSKPYSKIESKNFPPFHYA